MTFVSLLEKVVDIVGSTLISGALRTRWVCWRGSVRIGSGINWGIGGSGWRVVDIQWERVIIGVITKVKVFLCAWYTCGVASIYLLHLLWSIGLTLRGSDLRNIQCFCWRNIPITVVIWRQLCFAMSHDQATEMSQDENLDWLSLHWSVAWFFEFWMRGIGWGVIIAIFGHQQLVLWFQTGSWPNCYNSHGLFSFLTTLTPLWLISLMLMTHCSHTYSTMTHLPLLYFYYIYS